MQAKKLNQNLWLPLASAALLSGCIAPLQVSECPSNPAQYLLIEINAARSQERVPPLWADVRLARAADSHARALAEGEATGHFGLDGSDPLERMEDAGYLPQAFGENIAQGSVAPTLIVQAWLESPGHRVVLLDPAHEAVGLGGVLDTDHPIWVADFGAEKEPPTARCHPWPAR